MIDRIGETIARELARFDAGAGLAAVVEAWPAAVGAEIARNAWPARVARDGTLHVHAASAAWAFELTHLEARIREALGEVAPRRIRFAIGPLPEPAVADDERPYRAVVQPSDDHRRHAAALTAPIGDENLRKIVAKAASLSLANAESGRRFW